MQSKIFSVNKTLNVKGRIVDLSKPRVMGIVNITPDSFYTKSRFMDEKTILTQCDKMLAQGATFIDIGGYSSRPGAEDISVEVEAERSLQATRAIIKHFPDTILSIDTFRSSIAKACLDEGASIINDISGGELDPEMIPLVAQYKASYIVMHMRGTPQTMQQFTSYEDLIIEVTDYLNQKIEQLHQSGITDIIVDPGFGFSKTVEQNFKLLENLEYLKMLGKPILVGLSRKSMICRTLSLDPENALNGTTALHAIALYKGAGILRVHDVPEAMETIELISQLR